MSWTVSQRPLLEVWVFVGNREAPQTQRPGPSPFVVRSLGSDAEVSSLKRDMQCQAFGSQFGGLAMLLPAETQTVTTMHCSPPRSHPTTLKSAPEGWITSRRRKKLTMEVDATPHLKWDLERSIRGTGMSQDDREDTVGPDDGCTQRAEDGLELEPPASNLTFEDEEFATLRARTLNPIVEMDWSSLANKTQQTGLPQERAVSPSLLDVAKIQPPRTSHNQSTLQSGTQKRHDTTAPAMDVHVAPPPQSSLTKKRKRGVDDEAGASSDDGSKRRRNEQAALLAPKKKKRKRRKKAKNAKTKKSKKAKSSTRAFSASGKNDGNPTSIVEDTPLTSEHEADLESARYWCEMVT